MNQAFLKRLTETFAVGETKEYRFWGDFFKLESQSGVGLVTVRPYHDVYQYGEFDVFAGFKVGGVPFNRILVTSATAQNVTFLVGAKADIQSDTIAGVVGVSSLPAVGFGGISQPVKLDDPLASSSSYKSSTLLAAGAAENILAPAVNVSGVTLIRAGSIGGYNGSKTGFFCTGTAAPTNSISNEIILNERAIQMSSSIDCFSELNQQVKIPAGQGLWFFAVDGQTWSRRHAAWR